MAGDGEELAQLLCGQDLRAQLFARNPSSVEDEDDGQTDEGNEPEDDVYEDLGTESVRLGTGGIRVRPLFADHDEEQEHADDRGDACPEEGSCERAAGGARSHASSLPGRELGGCRPKV